MIESPTGSIADQRTASLQKSLSNLAAQQSACPQRFQDEGVLDLFRQEAKEQLTTIRMLIEQLPDPARQNTAIYRLLRSIQAICGGAHLLGLGSVENVASHYEAIVLAAGSEPMGDFDLQRLIREMRLLDATLGPFLADRLPPGSPPPSLSAVSIEPASKEPPATKHRPFTIRMDSEKLNHIVDAVGELIVAETVIRDRAKHLHLDDEIITSALEKFLRATTDVRRSAMSMRMVPASQLFGRVDGLVRDLSRELGREIRFETVGGGTQFDKVIAERICRPLLHIVHHAVCKNLEPAAVRQAAGKPLMGSVCVSAQQRGPEIIIEVSDDGLGNTYTELVKALHEKEQPVIGRSLTDAESAFGDLIALKASTEVTSVPQRGTTLRLRLPVNLTLAQGLVVRAGKNLYFVPNYAVHELVQPSRMNISKFDGHRGLALFRDDLVALSSLSSALGVPGAPTDLRDGLFVVIDNHNKRFAFWAEELVGTQEVIVKSLGESLRDIRGIQGCGIMRNGKIVLILELRSLCSV